MSLLQTTDRVTETDENLLVFKLPDDVTLSRTVNVLGRAAVLLPLIAGIIISIATLVGALLH
jgi:hypothetical protein